MGNYLECVFPFLGVRYISVNDGYDSDDYKGVTSGMDVVLRNIIYEPEVQAAVTAAMNELFRQQTARQMLADCIAAALAGTGDDTSLPAVEAKLRALQEEQMRLFHMAADAGPENTEYDDRLIEVSTAIAALLTRKGELEQEGTDTECDSRVRFITDALETTGSAIEGFDEGMVCQTVASITVLDAERLSIRFKDGTEIEQIIECAGRASA